MHGYDLYAKLVYRLIYLITWEITLWSELKTLLFHIFQQSYHVIVCIFCCSFQAKKQSIFIMYLQYIKDCLGRPGSGINEKEIILLVKNSVILATNDGLKSPSAEVIHFSSEYACHPDLLDLFPGNKHSVKYIVSFLHVASTHYAVFCNLGLVWVYPQCEDMGVKSTALGKMQCV